MSCIHCNRASDVDYKLIQGLGVVYDPHSLDICCTAIRVETERHWRKSTQVIAVVWLTDRHVHNAVQLLNNFQGKRGINHTWLSRTEAQPAPSNARLLPHAR